MRDDVLYTYSGVRPLPVTGEKDEQSITRRHFIREHPRLSNLRFGVGVGARLYTNFGPIRLDVATPLDRRPGEARISIYVSIGQAF